MNIENKLLNIIKSETIPAIGCTEPIAVAYATSIASKYISDDLKSLKVLTSKGIFKNGKFVKIPNTNLHGLDLAAIVGFLYGDYEKELLVLEDIKKEDYLNAKSFLNQNIITVDYIENTEPVYIKIIAKDKENKVEVILKNSHNHIETIILNNQIIYENPYENISHDKSFIKDLSFSEMINIIENIPIEKLSFIQNGIDMNIDAAKKGLKYNCGLNIGKGLNSLAKEGYLSLDAPTKARIFTTAAADIRMGGDICPIMTSAGSGNQGLTAVLPIVIVAEEQNISKENILRAVFLSHIINNYVKLHTGKLSFLCGCAIAAGIGSSSAISWMLNGTYEQICGAANNMLSNLAGMICDGAKESCTLKLGTSSAESIISAYLANKDIIIDNNIGIIGENIEESIENIGILSKKGYPFMDSTIIDFFK